jgi:hypothetical protein
MAMRMLSSIALALGLLLAAPCEAGFLDDLFKGIAGSPADEGEGELSEATIAGGLREALSVATRKAVDEVSRVDGYFGNPEIRIPFPEKIRNVADVLRKVGFEREVEEFVLSMNRAAESAAPEAASIFLDAVREMTVEDARSILGGGDTAATEYFREKTSERLYGAFKPRVRQSMDSVGVTRAYNGVIDRYDAIPFMSSEGLDLDHYVTTKALEGLFYMLGQEERKIRTDPAARVTELLKKVFGRQG